MGEVVRLGDFDIYFYDFVDSTQDLARSLGEVREFTTIVARVQRKARGRFGREWCSPQGGLWFTTILYPKTSVSTYAILCLLTSLSIARAIEDVTRLNASIKWPNDVYVNGKKIAGVLIESDVINNIVEKVLVGVGLNLNFRIDALPEELRGRATTLLEEYGKPVDLEFFLLKILHELKKNYEEYKAGSHYKLIESIKSRMEILGKLVFIHLSSGKLIGVVRDLEVNGDLVVESSDTKFILNPSDIRKLEVI
ncbi:MAG: biotin--[acetyl-CoA-carboxylase] ligase [Nitrososphaerota archaeon]|nr:biotin--[acetyl-CoA-carboxylase] ligase [Candidatus Geocrenenecus dongiae]